MGEKIVYAKLFKSVSYLGGKVVRHRDILEFTPMCEYIHRFDHIDSLEAVGEFCASSQSGKSSKSAKRQLPSSMSSEEDVVVDK